MEMRLRPFSRMKDSNYLRNILQKKCILRAPARAKLGAPLSVRKKSCVENHVSRHVIISEIYVVLSCIFDSNVMRFSPEDAASSF